MGLGKLTDYKKLYDPSDHAKRDKGSLEAAKLAMATCPAAFQYFGRVPGKVYQCVNCTTVDAAILIGVDRDFMSVIPPNAEFKAFNSKGVLGFVLINPGTKALSLYDPGGDASRAQRLGLWYDNVGGHQGKTVFARLDRQAIGALQAGKALSDDQLNVYETSMKKGVIPSGSTGSDGIKFDNNTWVVKVTIAIAQANQMDNSLSPSAAEVRDGEKIFLNFNQLVLRH